MISMDGLLSCVFGLAMIIGVMVSLGAFRRPSWKQTSTLIRKRPRWFWVPAVIVIWWPVCVLDTLLAIFFSDNPKSIEHRESVGAGLIKREQELNYRDRLCEAYGVTYPGELVTAGGTTGRFYSGRDGVTFTLWDDQIPMEGEP